MRFSDTDKGRIAALVDQGWSGRRIARRYKWGARQVQRLVNEYKSTGNFENRMHRTGRKRITSKATDRVITRSVLGSPEKRRISSKKISSDLAGSGIQVSSRTVRRRLQEVGLNSEIAKKKPYLRKVNVQKRLIWAKKHEHWKPEDWEKVLWSDEAPFQIFGGKACHRVRRRENEKLHPHCVEKTVKFGGGKVMLWGCFSSTKTGPLIQVKGKMDKHAYKQILIHHARPTLKTQKKSIFQQDNDPKHTAKTVKQYLAGKRWPAKLLEWPSQSPDLNPIENLWSILDKEVRMKNPSIKNSEELVNELQLAWANLDPSILRNLVHSMPRRCKAVIEAKGYWTKY